MSVLLNPKPSLPALEYHDQEVFNGNTPGAPAWTNLDLSTWIGAQKRLCMLSFKLAAGGGTTAVRTEGDTEDYWSTAEDAFSAGVALSRSLGGGVLMVHLVVTNSAGILEWKEDVVTQNMIITLMMSVR